MAQYFNDFGAYPTGSAPADWTARGVYTSYQVANIVADAAAPGGKVLTLNTTAAGAPSFISPNTVGSVTGDVEIVTEIVGPASGAAEMRIVICGNDTTNASYMATFSTFDTGPFRILKDASTVLATTPFTYAKGLVYRMRLSKQGTTIRARLWLASDPEPATWTLSVTDSTYTSGYVGPGVYDTTPGKYRFVGVGTGVDLAPTSAPFVVGPSVDVSAPPAMASGTAPSPAMSAGAALTSPAASAAAAAPGPAVSAGASLTAPAAKAAGAAPAPAVSAGVNIIAPAARAGGAAVAPAVSVAAAGAVTISDLFNRADSITTLGVADTGQAWTALRGTWGISASQAYTPNNVDAVAVIDAGVTDATVQMTLPVANSSHYVLFRCQDADNFLAIMMPSSGGNYFLYKREAGVFTALAQATGGSAAGDTITVELVGSSITLKRAGVTLLTATSTLFPTATKYGMSTGSNSRRFDSFSVSTAAAPAGLVNAPSMRAAGAVSLPTISSGVTIACPAASAAGAARAPGVSVGVAVACPAIGAAGAAPAPGAGAGVGVIGPAAGAAGAGRVPSLAAGVAVAAAVMIALAGMAAPTASVGGGVNVAAPSAGSAAAVAAPTVSAGAVVSAPASTAQAQLPAPAIGAGVAAAVTAPSFGAQAAVRAPTLSAGVAIAAPSGTSQAAMRAPQVGSGAAGTVIAPPASAGAAVPVPTVSVGVAVAVPSAKAAAAVAAPVVSAGTTAGAPAATATASSPAPTASAGTAIPAPSAKAAAAGPAPVVAAGVRVVTPTGQATASAGASVSAGVVIQAPSAGAAAALAAPLAQSGGGAAVVAPAASAQARPPVPTVRVGVAVIAPAAGASAAAHVPVVVGGDPIFQGPAITLALAPMAYALTVTVPAPPSIVLRVTMKLAEG